MAISWGVLAEALSLIFQLAGSAYSTRLFDDYSWMTVGALNAIFGAVLFSFVVRIPSGEKKEHTAKIRWGRIHWKLAIILTIPSALQNQVRQAGLERVGIGTLTAVMVLGLLSVSAWRLVFPPGRRARPWHAGWPVLALAGIVLLTRPLGGGADVLGLAAAGIASAIGVNYLIVAGRLSDLGVLPQAIVLLRWTTACLVGVPVLALTGDDWTTRRALSTAAVAAALIVAGNWLHLRAYHLVRSDGVIGAVGSLNPVFACLVGLVVARQSPGIYGWIGAGLVVAASGITLRLLQRERRDVVQRAVEDGACWKPPPGDPAGTNSTRDADPGAWPAGPGIWTQDKGVPKHHLA